MPRFTIDSRELIDEAAEIRERIEDGEPVDGAERDRLLEIEQLAEAGIPDWQYGVTLIEESEFEDYARELAEDIGAVDPNASWPYTCIDWEKAARELSTDYTSVTFDGTDYYVRG